MSAVQPCRTNISNVNITKHILYYELSQLSHEWPWSENAISDSAMRCFTIDLRNSMAILNENNANPFPKLPPISMASHLVRFIYTFNLFVALDRFLPFVSAIRYFSNLHEVANPLKHLFFSMEFIIGLFAHCYWCSLLLDSSQWCRANFCYP